MEEGILLCCMISLNSVWQSVSTPKSSAIALASSREFILLETFSGLSFGTHVEIVNNTQVKIVDRLKFVAHALSSHSKAVLFNKKGGALTAEK
jgi:hypothetical protein